MKVLLINGSRAAYSGELSLPITGVLNGVHPWSIEHPTLYTLTVQLIRPGSAGLPDRVLDEKTIRFGFRTVQFVAGGLYLNGQRVELRGLNRHQSYAYQGYAMPDSIQRLDAQILKKDLGCNAARTSHSPQSPAFLDACDELGLLVFTETHRLVQALRYAAGINDSIAQQGVAGSFGWCMADYNTHREFGSGDRICYHGVMDMFRNPKLSAAVYASQKTPRSPSDIVLEVSSGMALGDLPGGVPTACWVFTNAESVRLYRGNDYIAEFTPDRHGRFAAMTHPPIEINDFVGSLLEKYEGMDPASAQMTAAILNEMRRDAMELSPLSKARMLSLRLSWNEVARMYYKYIGVLGTPCAAYRFEAVWHGRTVRTVVREPVQSVRLECTVHNPILTDGPTWDCAAVSLRAIDQNGSLLPYCGEAVQLSVDGPLKIIGPSVVPLRGGMAGTYLATTGEAGRAVLHCRMEGALDTDAVVTIRCREA